MPNARREEGRQEKASGGIFARATRKTAEDDDQEDWDMTLNRYGVSTPGAPNRHHPSSSGASKYSSKPMEIPAPKTAVGSCGSDLLGPEKSSTKRVDA